MLTEPGAVALTPWVAAGLILTGIMVTVTDLRERRIYNKVTFPMILAGLVVNALPVAWGVAAGDYRIGLYGFAVGLGVLLPAFAINMIKAGDVKYLAGVGALGGPWVALFTFLYGSLAHGALSLVVLARRGEVKAAFTNIGYWFSRTALTMKPADFEARTQGQLPYAASLALGLVVSVGIGLTRGNVFPPWA
ncbi:MAG: prepilin peptidase [Armatimonadetes bacterium]|nr:prepilin peptidase [Armatimonadota bacterium]